MKLSLLKSAVLCLSLTTLMPVAAVAKEVDPFESFNEESIWGKIAIAGIFNLTACSASLISSSIEFL